MAYAPGAITSLMAGGKKKTTKRKKKDEPDEREEMEAMPGLFEKKVKKPREMDTSTSLFEKRINEPVMPKLEDVSETIVVKKKSKPEKTEDDNTTRRNLTEQRRAERKEAEDRTIFVGNAPTKTKPRAIKKLFSRFGLIEAVYQRSLLQKSAKLTLQMLGTDKSIEKNLTSTNFYVRFKDADDARSAVELNGFVLDNQILRVTLDNKKEFNSTHTVFVGNLPFSVKESEIRDHFSSCGAIDGIRLMYDKVTGQGRGIAYVAFVDRASALLALNLNEKELAGRNLRISKVLKKNKRPTDNNPKSAKLNRRKQHKEQENRRMMNKISNFSTMRNVKGANESAGDKKLSKKTRKAIKKRTKGRTKKSLMS